MRTVPPPPCQLTKTEKSLFFSPNTENRIMLIKLEKPTTKTDIKTEKTDILSV